jgi:NAD(P)-dependent dehydrogenase (short-subunit alcohol dehydrogenase family)
MLVPSSEFKKQVLISGATRGIGLAMVKSFLKLGFNVIAVARNVAALEDLPRNESQSLRAISADLSTFEGCSHVAKEIKQQDLKLDCLINNAGVAQFQSISAVDEEALLRQVNLNLLAPLRLSRDLLSQFNHNASIINVSSYFARRMLHDRPSSVYSATKGGLESFTRALAFELGSRQIRVNAIAPGSVRTSLLESNLEKLSEPQRQSFFAQIPQLYPLGRLGTSEDVAQLAAFLASENAMWITGSVFTVDGGLTTH